MNNIEKGVVLAREIFACGNAQNDKVQRIELKGGTYPGKETNCGGFCESALANFIARELDKLDAVSEEVKP